MLKKVFLIYTIIFCFLPVILMANPEWSVRMAESVMQRHSNRYGGWDYVTGTVLRGFEELWRATGDQRYYDYIQSTVDYVVNGNGTIDGYSVSAYNIDEINEGRMVLLMYKETGLEKYKLAADLLRSQLADHPRTSLGGFWHKQIYPWQMWLDGLYMGSPFYTEYGLIFNEPEDFDDVVLQLTQMEVHARDSLTGLLYHGWDESRQQAWADSVTGKSPNFWGRGIGWYAMALVDVLDFLPSDHAGRDTVIGIVNRLAEAMFNYQDASGLWWQVVDQGGREGNYLESSVSCMMAYSMTKAVRLGYLDDSYLSDVLLAYQGILDQFITVNPDCTISLTQTCCGAGLGGNPYRDGSYEYYVYQTSICVNDGKAVGPFIAAGIEIERLTMPNNFSAEALSGSSIKLTWTNPGNGGFDGYQIQRSSGAGFSEIARIPIEDSVYTDTDLQPLTIYSYRIRPYIGEQYSVFSEIVQVSTLAPNGAPAYPLNPLPANGVTDQEWNTKLTWEAGAGAVSHDVYFGENTPPPFRGNQTETTFDPGMLAESTTYYWQINGVNVAGTTTGPIWTFSTKSAPPPLGVVAEWSFEDGTGTTILDSSQYENHALLQNSDQSAWQPGVQGSAVVFDGVDDYAVVSHDDVFNFAEGSFSISFWIKHTAQDRAMRYIIKGTHDPLEGSGKRYEVFHHQSNNIRFSIDDNSVKSVVEVANTNFATGNWVHVVAIRDTETGIMKIYADKELIGTAEDNTGDISQDEDLFLGVSPDEENTNYEGALDEVCIFNYAINDSIIESLYDDGITDIQSKDQNNIPQTMVLKAFPNPFNNIARISYSVPHKEHVEITVFTITGQKVAVLLDDVKTPGSYTFSFNADHLSSGIFLIRLVSGSQYVTRKIVLIK